ncbi:MAG: hypothetical protein AAGN66_02940 [Acidobacteriota bacterium]
MRDGDHPLNPSQPTPTPRELDRARGAADALAERFGLPGNLAPYAPLRWRRPDRGDAGDGAVLHLEDFSAIPFLKDIVGVDEYQHRARVRASEGQLFAAATEPAEGYEDYCRDRLGLGRVTFVHAPGGGTLSPAEACLDADPLGRLVTAAKGAGAMTFHPYMGIDAVWRLGAEVRRRAGVPVSVLAPPPPVTWIANDKAAFGSLVRAVLGDDAWAECFDSAVPEQLAAHLLDLTDRHTQVGLKRLRCASAMGNRVFDGAHLRSLGTAGVDAAVREFLATTEWDGEEEVQAVAWLGTDCSPSTQLFIPPDGLGDPQVDGIYEQLLEGPEKVFLGSRPSTLPAEVHGRLANYSLRLATALQRLGYVGRCSFDFLLLGDPEKAPRLVLTECNGRWGGTSTPMTLVDRVTGGERPPYRAQDVLHPGLVGRSLAEVLGALGDEAFDARSGRGRYLLYNVGPLRRFGKLDVIALGRTQGEAEDALEIDLPGRLGLSPVG